MHDLKRLNPTFQLPFVGRKIQKLRIKRKINLEQGQYQVMVHISTWRIAHQHQQALPRLQAGGCACSRSHKAM